MADLGVTLGDETHKSSLTTGGDASDFFALMKPRVMSLVIFTALVGMMAAPGSIHPVIGFFAVMLIAIGAGASGALNMWYDADIDRLMQRTIKRPIPAGRVTEGEALAFGSIFSAGSVLCLGVMVNWVAAGLLAMTIAYYLFVYTMGLKRRTPHNIVIGGAAGAFPPMIGWAAVTGTVSLESIVLFLIIFMWTPPHFWALALYRSDDYKRANVPMLPVVAGPDETRKQILLYSLATWCRITLLPTAIWSLPVWFMAQCGQSSRARCILWSLPMARLSQPCAVRNVADKVRQKAVSPILFFIFLHAVLHTLLAESMHSGY